MDNRKSKIAEIREKREIRQKKCMNTRIKNRCRKEGCKMKRIDENYCKKHKAESKEGKEEEEDREGLCKGITKKGEKCKNRAKNRREYCHAHDDDNNDDVNEEREEILEKEETFEQGKEEEWMHKLVMMTMQEVLEMEEPWLYNKWKELVMGEKNESHEERMERKMKLNKYERKWREEQEKKREGFLAQEQIKIAKQSEQFKRREARRTYGYEYENEIEKIRREKKRMRYIIEVEEEEDWKRLTPEEYIEKYPNMGKAKDRIIRVRDIEEKRKDKYGWGKIRKGTITGYMITISPENGKEPWDLLFMSGRGIAEKLIKSKGVSRVIWAIEQSGTEERLGDHPHLHMVVEIVIGEEMGEWRKIGAKITGKIKAKIPKQYDSNKHETNYLALTHENHAAHVNYVKGIKDDKYKQGKVELDKKWRRKIGIEDYYTLEK